MGRQVPGVPERDRDLDVVELERFAQPLAALERGRCARLERLADLQAEVVVQQEPVTEHDPLAEVDTPLASRLDDLDGAAITEAPHRLDFGQSGRALVCRSSA